MTEIDIIPFALSLIVIVALARLALWGFGSPGHGGSHICGHDGADRDDCGSDGGDCGGGD